MKPIVFSPSFNKQLKRLKISNPKLFTKIKKQLKLFEANPTHPSLRLHKLKGNLNNTWSLSVTRDFRLIFISDKEYYFFDLGTHDQVYK